jgi:hypothetical protein
MTEDARRFLAADNAAVPLMIINKNQTNKQIL